jgi:hypothetical protein
MVYEILISIAVFVSVFIYMKINYRNMSYYDYCDMVITEK